MFVYEAGDEQYAIMSRQTCGYVHHQGPVDVFAAMTPKCCSDMWGSSLLSSQKYFLNQVDLCDLIK